MIVTVTVEQVGPERKVFTQKVVVPDQEILQARQPRSALRSILYRLAGESAREIVKAMKP